MLLVVLLVGYVMWDRLVESMIFYPVRGVAVTPEQLGIEGEEVYFTTEDGVRIHAFYLPAPGARRALLFLHGNAGNASHRLPNASELVRLACSVLVIDYRGYGLSEGRATEAGVYADARAALGHLIEQRGYSENRIVVFGRSLGGAVAVDLAQGRKLAGLILESTFPSIAEVVASGPAGRLFRALAGRRFESASKIGQIKAPLLFFHGDRDEVIGYELGKRLFDTAPEPKTFETIRGAGHNDLTQVGGRRYFDRIRQFLEEVAPSS
ncbi:MAG: alpha/beta hydrolase [Deltaproteobacteria bacterium]|nr:alpha/beta hydrolase [Deltaproteobacteria bacterium]MBW2693004.1 alpha/beta hydrolase [Deltaproteobacteria bacterium]